MDIFETTFLFPAVSLNKCHIYHLQEFFAPQNMAAKNSDDYDETTAIKRSYSQELGSSPADIGPPSSLKYGLPKRYVVACMAFLGFGKDIMQHIY